MSATQAITQDVNYPFALALDAARDLWVLAGVVTDEHDARLGAYTAGKVDWIGHHADTFADRMRTAGHDATTIAEQCRPRARPPVGLGPRRAGPAGQARWVQRQKDNDNLLENAWEFFAGEDDYGPPPGDPPDPTAPDFAPTRRPWTDGCGW